MGTSVGVARWARDDAVFARSLVEFDNSALTAVARGDDARPLLTAWLGSTVDALAVTHVEVASSEHRSTLCLWRRESDTVTSTVSVDIPEPATTDGSNHSWLSSNARRLVLEWSRSPHVAELPIVSNRGSAVLVAIGTRERIDGRTENRLSDVHRHLTVIERVRAALRTDSRLQPEMPPARLDDSPLTDREAAVLHQLAEGHLARTIATRLGISERTVHKHLGNIYSKLEVHDRMLAVREATERGWLGPALVTDHPTGTAHR